MKRSELKEAIKAEITSVLSEAMSDEEREDKLQQAKRGGGKEEPLRKLAAIGKKADEKEVKEAMFNEDAALEDIMLAIDLHLDGQIDYNEMSRRVEDLILGKEKSNFRVMNEGKRGVVVDPDEIKFHLDQFYGGNIDGNDLANAIEEILSDMMKRSVSFADIREEDEGPSKKEVEAEKSIAKQKDIELSKQQRKKEVADFMKKMQDKGIVGKDKKVLDSAKYKEEFAKFKADLKK